MVNEFDIKVEYFINFFFVKKKLNFIRFLIFLKR